MTSLEGTGITRILLSRELDGRPVYWTAAYLVGELLIDTGCPHTRDELLDFLGRQGLLGGAGGPGRTKLLMVANTHAHEDHIGANARLQHDHGAKLLAHREAVPDIEHPPVIQPYRELTWGRADASRPEPIGSRLVTRAFDGGRLDFEVIETPGHARGHVSLVEPERGWCFSGDLFVGVEFKVARADEDLGAMARSMRRLARAETAGGGLTLYTGIGQVFPDGHRHLAQCADRLVRLTAQARRLAGDGLTPPDIRDRLFGRESSLAALTGGHYSSEWFVRHLLAPSFEDLGA